MNFRRVIFTASVLATLLNASGQNYLFEYKDAPPASAFKTDGYWVWCGSVIESEGIYHLFASRWPKTGPFPEGYRQNSEIVRATAPSSSGPWTFKEVVIGERDSSFWDSNMAHNPSVYKVSGKYVLFYIGSDFTTMLPGTKSLLRRVGYAVADTPEGPWTRCDKPLIGTESNNPALLDRGDSLFLVYRDQSLRVFLAAAGDLDGPWKTINDNVWPGARIEDFYLFADKRGYHMICEDNTGGISGHTRWGVHLTTRNLHSSWEKGDPLIVYDHDIKLQEGKVINCTRRERPQLLIENNKITALTTGVYTGDESWSQTILLRKPIKIK